MLFYHQLCVIIIFGIRGGESMDIGLNLYSLRNQIKDEKAFLKTMETLREIGISFVQYS